MIQPQRRTPGRYFDYNGSTPLHPRVQELCARLLQHGWGNSAAPHPEGTRARELVERAREQLASGLNAKPEEIYFTSGGTESNNWALFASARRRPGGHLVTSSIEHKSVLESARELERQGFELTFIDPRRDGAVHLRDVQAALRKDTCLVSVMWANNETGVMQPVREIASLCRRRGIRFHTDAVCVMGKLPIDVQEVECDLLSLSAHKLHAPKGCGVLYIREGVELGPLLFGCGHQRGLRSGTENTPAIAGFGEAVSILGAEQLDAVSTLESLRQHLWNGIHDVIPSAERNGAGGLLPNTLNVWFPGASAIDLQLRLAELGFSVAAGASASSGSSHVLLAMGLGEERASQSLRFSLGSGTRLEDIDDLLEHLAIAVEACRPSTVGAGD